MQTDNKGKGSSYCSSVYTSSPSSRRDPAACVQSAAPVIQRGPSSSGERMPNLLVTRQSTLRRSVDPTQWSQSRESGLDDAQSHFDSVTTAPAPSARVDFVRSSHRSTSTILRSDPAHSATRSRSQFDTASHAQSSIKQLTTPTVHT